MTAAHSDKRIRPWDENPRFWQYDSEPVLLLGGSVKDNLFQIPELEAHLDLLVSVGGNYIRNTMSDRPDQGFEVKAFGQGADGRYDLTTWNDEYWTRLADMLRWTAQRQVFVQIEMWDRFDHSRDNWQSDPFNPGNNVNYTHEESGLAADYAAHPGKNEQPFFYTVPALQDNQVVLTFQQAFVDRVLEHTLKYDHVLYCMDNETSGDPAWSRYWGQYIRERAREAGATVEITEMWDNWDVRHETHRPTFDDPAFYTFVDIAQNSHNPGQTNWDRAQWVRAYLADAPRPMNSTKIYGADTSKWTDRGVTSQHAEQTFWRNLLGGFASSRFHRPPSGLGLSDRAQSNLRSARMLQQRFDLFHAEPDADSALLRDRSDNEAYLSRIPNRQYAVLFPDGGSVGLRLDEVGDDRTLSVARLDIAASRWVEADPPTAKGGGVVHLAAPAGPHVILLTVETDG